VEVNNGSKLWLLYKGYKRLVKFINGPKLWLVYKG
jgi:hypothetical protein